MPSGGPRASTPGTLYPNRRDMAAQPAQAPRGQTYGQAGAQLASQAVVPVAGARSGAMGRGATPQPTGPQPGQVPSLADPTTMPDQPVTAGLPNSPGPGPEVLTSGMSAQPSEELSIVRGLYKRYKYPSLLGVIEYMESRL